MPKLTDEQERQRVREAIAQLHRDLGETDVGLVVKAAGGGDHV